MPVTIHKEYRHTCIGIKNRAITLKKPLDHHYWDVTGPSPNRFDNIAYCPLCGEDLEKARKEAEETP